jgi:SAM-dependent methyltransferase
LNNTAPMRLKTETLHACPVCQATELRELVEVPDFESSTGTYGIVECAGCGVAFTNPRPLESELPFLYSARATADFPEMRSRLVGRLRDWAIDRYVSRQLASVAIPSDRPFEALDFGCGDGALSRGLLRHAQRRDAKARVAAVDFHPESPPGLRDAEASRIGYWSYERWLGTSDRYDVVFLRHVLEHHPEPLRLLKDLGAVLRPGGRLFVEVPNRRSVWAKAFGRFYSGYYIPRHLMHFDVPSLRFAIEKSGLRCTALIMGHTPLLGRSIAYRTGRDLGNLGLLGLATYPVQVAVDVLAHASTTLQATAAADG